jgi:hypothetical protein
MVPYVHKVDVVEIIPLTDQQGHHQEVIDFQPKGMKAYFVDKLCKYHIGNFYVYSC